MKAFLLAIGTELTEGQITNRNAVYLSEQLARLGIEVVRHETVADDRGEILGALVRAESAAELIFVTGGLGPTSDDFTRELAAEWLGETLEYREESWKKIVHRLESRGIIVAESNRQQCFFPRGAEVLPNAEGTADGFRVERGKVQAWFLPGPPREIAALWSSAIEPRLQKLPGLRPRRLFRWKCIGESESRLGEIVETALVPYAFAHGFRASPPYVEVKLWVPENEVDSEPSISARGALDLVLRAYSVARDDADLAENFLMTLARDNGSDLFTILDVGSDGTLTNRILSALRSAAGKAERGEAGMGPEAVRSVATRLEILTRFPHDRGAGGNPSGDADALPEGSPDPIFALFPGGKAFFLHRQTKESLEITSPYRSTLLRERENSFYTERALAFFQGIFLRRERSDG